MSTSGLIAVIDDKLNKHNVDIKDLNNKSFLNIYNHWDSYPEGLGESLNELIHTDGFIHRINDVPYLASAVASWVVDRNKSEMKQISDYNGTGILPSISLDCFIEYVYIINLHEHHVRCYCVYCKDFELENKLKDLVRRNKNIENAINDEAFYDLKFVCEYEFGTTTSGENKPFSVGLIREEE